MFFISGKINSSLYSSFIFNTISSQYIHTILILIEFTFGIFPLLSSLVPKIHFYSFEYKLSPYETHFCLFSKPKLFLLKKDNNISLPLYYYLPILFIIIISLISFTLLNTFYSKKTEYTFIDKFIINYFNLFFFRYFNFLLLDPIFYASLYLFYFFISQGTENLFFSLLILTVISIYIVNIIFFIKHCVIYINVANKKILTSHNNINNNKHTNVYNYKSNIHYPFLYFSSKYEIYILVLKIMIIVESNVFILSKHKVTNVVFTLNVCIFIVNVIIAIEMLLEEKQNKFDLFAHCYNKLTNSIRKILIFFSCIYHIINCLFYKENSPIRISIILFSLISSIGLWYFYSYCILMNVISRKLDLYIKDVIIYLLCNELPKEFNSNCKGTRGLFRKKLGNATDQLWKLLYNSVILNHLYKCKQIPHQCKTCVKLKDKHLYSVYDILYSIVMKDDDINIFDKQYNIGYNEDYTYNKRKKDYRDVVISILFNKIKGNIYECFKEFINVMSSSSNIYIPNVIRNTLSFIIEQNTINEKKHRNILLKLIIDISEYENDLKLTLLNFKEFLNEDISSKRADSIISISNHIITSRNKLSSMIKKFDITNTIEYKNKNKELSNEENIKIKSLQSTTRYALVILRFIIEIFTNNPFEKLHILNIELMDDFLDFHYNSDTLMILYLKQNGQCDIVTSSGLLENQTDCDINSAFPNQFKTEGSALLQQSVDMLKTQYDHHNRYQFLIKHNDFIKYFDYSYEISNMLFAQNVLLFGHYNTSCDKVMLLRHHHSTYKDVSDMFVENFSIEMGRLIKMRPLVMKSIYKDNQIKIKLSDLFTNFIQDYHHRDSIMSPNHKYNKEKQIFRGENSFQCELDYFLLNSNITKLLNNIKLSSKHYDINDNSNEVKGISLGIIVPKIKHILNQKALSNLYFVLTFTKLIDINESHTLYKVTPSPEPVYTSIQKDLEIFPELASIKNKAYTDVNNNINNNTEFSKFENPQVESNSSVCVSVKDNTSSTFIIKQKKIQQYRQTESIIHNEKQFYQKVKISVFILKFLLIPLLISFLIIQITNTNKLKNINNIYIKYNTLVCDFSNSFGSLLSLMCIADINSTFNNENCHNYMNEYLLEYQLNKINFSDFVITDYLLKENLFKVLDLSDNYVSLLQSVYEFGDENFLEIFNANVLEINIHDKGNNELTQTISYETFDTSIKNFLSSLMVIYSEEEMGMRFYEIPIYFLTFYNMSLHFDNLPQSYLNPIQKEIYQLLVNYVYFIVNFTDGEKLILNKIYDLRKRNIAITWIFITLVIILNILLMGLNCLQIKSANELFRKIILSILIQIENEKTKEFLSKKINNLLSIVELYSQKPSSIINTLITDQIKFNLDQYKKYKRQQKELERKYYNNIESNTSSTNNDDSQKTQFINVLHDGLTLVDANLNKDAKLILSHLTNNSYSLKQFYITNIIPLYSRNIIFNITHIVIIIIADIVLITFYDKVFRYFDYVKLNLSFVMSLYNGLSVSYLHRLLNLTDSDFAPIVKRDFLEDGLVNVYFRIAFDGYTFGNHLQRDGKFKALVEFITPTCYDFYRELDDRVINNYINKYNVNANSVFNLFEKICEDFIFMTFGNLNWSVEDYSFLVIDLNNKYKDNDMQSLLNFSKDNTLHKAYMHFYFYLRPCLTFFIKSVLTPTILNDFYMYLVIVWMYLMVNLGLEVLLFILLYCFVEKKLNTIKRNLLVFDDTLF